MLWFESLLFYGCEEREQEKDDVDVALLPTIVEKVILPKLTGRGFRIRIEQLNTLGFQICFEEFLTRVCFLIEVVLQTIK